MGTRKPRLELTWIGKEERPKLEPRILLERPELSHRVRKRTEGDIFDNRLVQGDNLLALKALEQEFAGKVKCVYIDPPYNTGSAFAHYDDGIEHSLWLSLMRDRIHLLHRLLREDGTLWISVDDNEGHYLKVLCDEMFGRYNFVATCIWHKKHTRANDARWLSDNHDFILCYAKDKSIWRPNLLPRPEVEKGYTNPDDDERGVWASGPCHVKTPAEHCIYEITTPSGRRVSPPAGTSWRYTREKFAELVADNRIYFGKKGDNVPRYKRFLSEVQQGLVPTTLWLRDEVGDNQEAKTEAKALVPLDPFGTPKPERLIQRILTIATKPHDLVLDSFAGSGTTAAVAHKMQRKWITVELGDHAVTHCASRMKAVIEGDAGGISKSVDWNGGGGFKYYELAPSLLEKDKWGNWVVSKKYNAQMLAAAMCKLDGFRYEPATDTFWMHGKSSDSDFIYVTTQNLSTAQLVYISDQVGPDRTLLICCNAFRADKDQFTNLTVQKIPRSVLNRCEWGREDYSLNVQAAPSLEGERLRGEEKDEQTVSRGKKTPPIQDLPLFAHLKSKGELQ